MRVEDFHIGLVFCCKGKTWRCTDVGTRVIVAFRQDIYDSLNWYDGPPYPNGAEEIFDEDDMKDCYFP